MSNRDDDHAKYTTCGALFTFVRCTECNGQDHEENHEDNEGDYVLLFLPRHSSPRNYILCF